MRGIRAIGFAALLAGAFAGGGIERAEYTIGVRICDEHFVYITICRDAANCHALSDSGCVQSED